jgi:hypothetical protein
MRLPRAFQESLALKGGSFGSIQSAKEDDVVELCHVWTPSRPNSVCYPLVGETRQHHFDGTSLSREHCPKTWHVPTTREHAVLGVLPLQISISQKITVLANMIQERRFLLSPGYPLYGFPRPLSQEHEQLCAVLLHMTHGVQ